MAGEIAIAPGAVLQFEPSGLHMMILDLSAPLVEGNSLALTLRFRNAGSVSVQVAVQALTATSTHHGH
jgi:copper(I)-binding protein